MNDYTLTLRPISIGTYPTDPDPIERVADNYPPIRRDYGNDYGTLRYAAPLTFEKVWRYDLRPVDAVERAHYTFWLCADRNAERAALMEGSWRELSGDWTTDPALFAKIADMARHDTLAAAALVLWEAEWNC